MGILMGIYHQGGIVPAQIHLAGSSVNLTHALWWKTYSPPTWLLDGKTVNATTTDLMGIPVRVVMQQLVEVTPCITSGFGDVDGARRGIDYSEVISSSNNNYNSTVYLVAPLSAIDLDAYTKVPSSVPISAEEVAETETEPSADALLPIHLSEVWRTRKHLNLDDLDFGHDGIWPTLKRVVGRRGLVVWRVRRFCAMSEV